MTSGHDSQDIEASSFEAWKSAFEKDNWSVETGRAYYAWCQAFEAKYGRKPEMKDIHIRSPTVLQGTWD